MNITKLGYHEPRPFWASADVFPFVCSAQFGNPSGHSLTTIGRALLLWLDYVENCTTGFFSYNFVKVSLLVVCLAFGVLVGIARMVLGVHSLD